MKPISKLIMKCGSKGVLYLRGFYNLDLYLERITKVWVFERHVEVGKKCDENYSCI